MCMRHKSPVTSSFHFFHLRYRQYVIFQTKNSLHSLQMYFTQSSSLLCATVCVCVHVLWDRSLCKLWGETTTDCTHWNPQTPVHDPSQPSHLCFLSPPTKHLEGPQTPLPSSIYKKPLSSTSIPSSIHLPPFSWPPLYVLSISLCQALSNST